MVRHGATENPTAAGIVLAPDVNRERFLPLEEAQRFSIAAIVNTTRTESRRKRSCWCLASPAHAATQITHACGSIWTGEANAAGSAWFGKPRAVVALNAAVAGVRCVFDFPDSQSPF